MKQESQKDTELDTVRPEQPPVSPEPPRPALRPEDEAIVAERLRELGYIE
jgi:hypothetical protein